MKRWLPSILLLACAGCSTPLPALSSDTSSHVDRVLEDVTAMLEGMAQAHATGQVVLRGPEYRSSAPASAN